MSSKSVLQECQVRSVLQECQVRVSHKSVKQECLTKVSSKKCLTRVSSKKCPTRVSSKSVLQECQIRVSRKSVKQECLTGDLRNSVKQGRPTRVSPQRVNSGCLTSEFAGSVTNKYCLCLSTYVSAFGFVGFILFFFLKKKFTEWSRFIVTALPRRDVFCFLGWDHPPLWAMLPLLLPKSFCGTVCCSDVFSFDVLYTVVFPGLHSPWGKTQQMV